MTISRVTAVWTGFQGAPGYTALHFAGGQSGVPDDARTTQVRAFFNTLAPRLPNGVTVTVNEEIELIDEDTGVLTGYATGATVAPVEGNGTAAGSGFASPTGAVITWTTDTVSGGRRVQGRSFIIPLAASCYQSDGTLTTVALTGIRNAAALLGGSASGLVVWSRPRAGGGGVAAPVTGYRVPDMAAILRSRRD